MADYCELTIFTGESSLQEILVARLAAIGFDGFEETSEFLKAYIPEKDFDKAACGFLAAEFGLTYTENRIGKQNWNQLWESNFSPVQVDDFVGIRANFHPPFRQVEHEITITPKMSFGTGHHATTYSVIQMMRTLDFTGKTVFDFGTGTGILAILAEKLGATKVLGTDNDTWCIENASENIEVNQCKCIAIELVDIKSIAGSFDIILANINKHILLEHCSDLYPLLVPGGSLLLSGLLEADEEDIRKVFVNQGFVYAETRHKNGWIALSFNR